MTRSAPVLLLAALAAPLQAQTPTLPAQPSTTGTAQPVSSKASLASFGARTVAIRFFPGEDKQLTPSEARVYRETFDSAMARYVSIEVELSYPKLSSPQSFTLSCRYEGPNGYSATPVIDGTAQAGWSGSYHASGWGAKDPGTWAVGTYQVTCRDGSTVIGRGSFTVARASYDIPAVHGVVFGIRFFEGPKERPALADRKYASRFDNASTRWVFFELNLNYPKVSSATSFSAECRYDFPDGRSFTASDNYKLEAGWTGSFHTGGVGYDQTNQWPTGLYTVTCRHQGRVIATSGFYID